VAAGCTPGCGRGLRGAPDPAAGDDSGSGQNLIPARGIAARPPRGTHGVLQVGCLDQRHAFLRWAKSRMQACSAFVLDSNWPISSSVSNAEATNNAPPISLSSLTS
jgi:hypothetical protein